MKCKNCGKEVVGVISFSATGTTKEFDSLEDFEKDCKKKNEEAQML